MIVYKAISPSGRSYIGITSVSLNRRIIAHKSRAKHGSKLPFHCALRKYADQIKWEIIQEVSTWEEACFIERELIKSTQKLYNVSAGGDGTLGVRPSEKTRKFMSFLKIGAKNHMFGKRQTDETKRLISEANSGMRHTPETLHKMSIARLGSKNPKARKVIHLPTGKIWNCARDAAGDLGLNYSTIRNYLQGLCYNKAQVQYIDSEEKMITI